MDPGHNHRRRHSFLFPFDCLPIEVQSRILGLLPITTLVVCKAVSRSWRSLIRSPDFTDSYQPCRRDDFIFLFLSDTENQISVSAYLPSHGRWLRFRLPMFSNTFRTAGTSLLLHESGEGRYCVVNPFAPHTPPHMLPQPLNLARSHTPLTFIENNPFNYRIIIVSTSSDRFYFQIYNSRTDQWEPYGQLDRVFLSVESAVYLDGMLFCLTSSMNHIVTFNPHAGGWTILDRELPVWKSAHHRMLVFRGEIYLTGYVFKDPRIERIGIWELDRSTMTWGEVGFMPAEYIDDFIGCQFRQFDVVSCTGMICYSTQYPRKIVMCDLTERRWWRPGPWTCDLSRGKRMWHGHAIQPYIELLK